ncbi:MAG TPA: IgGFc-binding protein [Byssovorax sp.]|jgi:hypothetical protein
MLHAPRHFALAALVPGLALGVACSAGNSTGGFGGGDGTSTGSKPSGSTGSFVTSTGANTTSTAAGGDQDPTTCAEAMTSHSYVGCDFWPTVNANNVWSIFDYAIVVANAGDEMVTATVTQGASGSQVAMATIAPNSLGTLYLPWVASLKGPDTDQCGDATPLPGSVTAPGGAYHLTTSAPVTVYQFNALEYQGHGGPAGKSWAGCPGDTMCCNAACQAGQQAPYKVGCYSFSNDASLLLPSTAMTGNYRIIGHEGWIYPRNQLNPGGPTPVLGPDFTVTGTVDGTNVTILLSATGTVLAGGSIASTAGGGTLTFPLDAGDVVEIAGDPSSDFSGSLVQADQPVQVITGMPCVNIPAADSACDHIEESVLPAETLGQHYFVSRVAAPNLNEPPQPVWVKIYGNVDGTNLTYPAGVTPPSAPTTISAGQVVDLGEVAVDFEIQGDHEFAIATFTLAASDVDPHTRAPKQKGDPAQSIAIAVEQYRDKYIFLAPTDYPVNFVDVIEPMNAVVTLDGSGAPTPTQIGSSGYGINHLVLGDVAGGAHVLTSNVAVGIQVVGYGSYTSYAYPGGLNLKQIAPPPPH